jgi:hypothetical protein
MLAGFKYPIVKKEYNLYIWADSCTGLN